MEAGRTRRRVRRALGFGAALVVAIAASARVPPAARAANARAFPKDYFGISVSADLTQLPQATFRTEMNLMQQLGVRWLRVTVPWERVHHVEEYPDKWKLIDRVMAAAASRGMVVDAIVDNAPAWARDSVPHIPCTVQPPFDLGAYARFAAQLARRYPYSVLRAVELENSPNVAGVWPTPDPCAYATLMKTAYPRIKRVNKRVIVLNGGLGGVRSLGKDIPGDVFFAGLYRYGAQGSFDAVSFHPYSYPCSPSESCSKERSWDRLPDVRKTMVRNGDGAKKIWATEFGAPTDGNAGDGHVDEQRQSDIMLDAMTSFRDDPWSGPFFVFTIRDHGTDPHKKSDWFGLVDHDLVHKKIAFTTYRDLARGAGAPATSPRARRRR